MSARSTQGLIINHHVTGPYSIGYRQHIMIWHQYGFWYMDIYDYDTETWTHDVDVPSAWQTVGVVR